VTEPFLLDRMIALAEVKHCEPVVCLNKWDLVPAAELFQIYTQAGFHTLRVSAKTGLGLAELRALLAGKTSVFSGNTGVGKSSLLNALEPGLAIPVGEVSEKLGRGRHTTRHIELYPLTNGGLIADTPGFATFEEEDAEVQTPESLPGAFREFAPYLGKCRYQDCAHDKEPDCAVLDALARGDIAPSRHRSYLRLRQESCAAKQRGVFRK
jgi:ribosome biogenesis GTPase